MRVKKIGTVFFATIIMGLICIAALFGGVQVAHAESPVSGTDGRYNVSYTIGGQTGIGADMIARYMDGTVVVEKIGDNYYASVTQLSSSMEDLSLNLAEGMQVGYRITEDNGSRKTYSYTLSAENLASALPFSVFVAPRGETFTFTITLDLANATRVGDVEDTTTDRPGEFVPILSTAAGNEYEAAQGSVFTIPAATATLGDENCEVTVTAYYVRSGEQTEVEVSNNQFTLENAGEYHFVYRAESSQYQSLLGNNTFTEMDVTVTSVVGSGTLAKFEDVNGVLGESVSIQASRITEGSTLYSTAADKMASIADNFEVFGVSLINSDGSEATPAGEYALYLKAKSTFNRNEIVVYSMSDDGTLTKLSSENGGSYVRITTDRVGTFIVCIPGVAFIMPIWGYITIACVCVAIVVAAAVTVTVILVRRKKKAKKLQEKAIE